MYTKSLPEQAPPHEHAPLLGATQRDPIPGSQVQCI